MKSIIPNLTNLRKLASIIIATDRPKVGDIVTLHDDFFHDKGTNPPLVGVVVNIPTANPTSHFSDVAFDVLRVDEDGDTVVTMFLAHTLRSITEPQAKALLADYEEQTKSVNAKAATLFANSDYTLATSGPITNPDGLSFKRGELVTAKGLPAILLGQAEDRDPSVLMYSAGSQTLNVRNPRWVDVKPMTDEQIECYGFNALTDLEKQKLFQRGLALQLYIATQAEGSHPGSSVGEILKRRMP